MKRKLGVLGVLISSAVMMALPAAAQERGNNNNQKYDQHRSGLTVSQTTTQNARNDRTQNARNDRTQNRYSYGFQQQQDRGRAHGRSERARHEGRFVRHDNREWR